MIALAAGPFVLPVLGVRLADLLFGVPLVVLPWAAAAALAAGRRRPERSGAWRWIAVACASAAFASALGVVTQVAGAGATAGLYAGLAASACMVVGGAVLAHGALRQGGWAGLADPLLLAATAVLTVVYLVVIPGFAGADVVLTVVVVLDLAAFLLVAAGTAGDLPAGAKSWLILALAVICTGDATAVAQDAHLTFLPIGVTPVLWALAGWCLAIAAGRERSAAPGGSASPPEVAPRRTYARVLLPLAAIVAYPAIAVGVGLGQGDWVRPGLFFGPAFLLSTVVAFARQAVLLVEQDRAARREARLHAEARSRARELEALSRVASTMTEVLEERPVIARGLEALDALARTSSTALTLVRGEGSELVATTGAWGADRIWARTPHLAAGGPAPEPLLMRRGRREIAHVPLSARGDFLGTVTLVRPEREGSFEPELGLLRLIVDQLAVALQNARDYCEKLEAAIRDPLTGLYNRRFFYEAFAKEIARHERYGTDAALVLFDIDDFKRINDTLGHAAGDHVLQQVAAIAGRLVRPADTFARVGGEEFGLLLPETAQLDALLVAERLRTAVARQEILPGRPVTLSGGVAAMPQDGTTREALERAADQALYWAKRNGKNLCALANEALATDVDAVPQGMLAHLHGVVAGIDASQLHTRDHSENVASYAVAIGQALGLDPDRIVRVRRAAFLHDVGKVAVPNAILAKPGSLTAEEFAEIRLHPSVGATMLHHAGLHDEARWVRAHHERFDGAGYPDGLGADEIPLEARIIFVADAFEAMTSDRPYRPGMPVPQALAELRRCAGAQFAPQVVEAFVDLVEGDHVAVLALRASSQPGDLANV